LHWRRGYWKRQYPAQSAAGLGHYWYLHRPERQQPPCRV